MTLTEITHSSRTAAPATTGTAPSPGPAVESALVEELLVEELLVEEISIDGMCGVY